MDYSEGSDNSYRKDGRTQKLYLPYPISGALPSSSLFSPMNEEEQTLMTAEEKINELQNIIDQKVCFYKFIRMLFWNLHFVKAFERQRKPRE